MVGFVAASELAFLACLAVPALEYKTPDLWPADVGLGVVEGAQAALGGCATAYRMRCVL